MGGGGGGKVHTGKIVQEKIKEKKHTCRVLTQKTYSYTLAKKIIHAICRYKHINVEEQKSCQSHSQCFLCCFEEEPWLQLVM